MPSNLHEALEELMTTTTHRYHSDFARRYFAQGAAEGKARGEAAALLAILDARGIEVPDDIRVEISDCTDISQLETWIRRAATAEKIQDMLD
jgi:hypothetical protein